MIIRFWITQPKDKGWFWNDIRRFNSGEFSWRRALKMMFFIIVAMAVFFVVVIGWYALGFS